MNILFRGKLSTSIIAIFIFLFAISLIMYPSEVIKSSLHGLKIWWNVIFPILLPFFITAEIMIGFGVVHFLGLLLEPLMRPVFRVPGVGAFVMAVAFITGNPMGAKLTARLREENLISREEGERLVSFTSTAGPLFIFGAIAVGFFEDASLGIMIAIAHYASSFIVGFVMRFYQPHATPSAPPKKKAGFILFRAFRAMHQARMQDPTPFGKILGTAVTSSIQTLELIGGFIIVFSVMTHLIDYLGITIFLAKGIASILSLLSLPVELAHSLFVGIFEITLGSQLASATPSSIPLIYKCMIVSAILGFNGLSIHAQVVSLLGKTDIRYSPYLFSRILHGFVAGLLTLLIYPSLRLSFHPLSNHIFTFTNTMKVTTLNIWPYLQSFSYIIVLCWLFIILKQTFPGKN